MKKNSSENHLTKSELFDGYPGGAPSMKKSKKQKSELFKIFAIMISAVILFVGFYFVVTTCWEFLHTEMWGENPYKEYNFNDTSRAGFAYFRWENGEETGWAINTTEPMISDFSNVTGLSERQSAAALFFIMGTAGTALAVIFMAVADRMSNTGDEHNGREKKGM